MANIGTTTAFYKVESSLTRANNEVSKSMERLATGKQNANAGDRSSYVAMSDTFRLDFVGTKAGIKGASVAMGYLETGMRVLDAASGLLSRLQELAVLGANNTNTTQDHEAINAEAEALAEEFNRLMTTSAYKGKNVFVDNAGSEYVSVGGRNAEMTFGIGTITYTELYNSTARTIVSGPNAAATTFNLAHLPSDAVVAKAYGAAAATVSNTGAGEDTLQGGTTYRVLTAGSEVDFDNASGTHVGKIIASNSEELTGDTFAAWDSDIVQDSIFKTNAGGTINVQSSDNTASKESTYAEVRSDDNVFVKDETYVIYSMGDSNGNIATGGSDAKMIAAAATNVDGTAISGTLTVGQKFKIKSDANTQTLAGINSLTQNMTFTKASDTLTKDIEAVQAKINTARVQAGSQYAAMESAVDYTTDLTAQYELGFNT